MTDDRKQLAAWTLLFAVNLPVALLFATAFAGDSALAGAGVAAGLAPAWGAGLAAVWAGSRSRRTAFVGAATVALSQLFPVAHLMAGALAAWACWPLGFPGPSDLADARATPDPLHTFALTVLTSVPLLALAAVVGLAVVTWPRSGYEPTAEADDS